MTRKRATQFLKCSVSEIPTHSLAPDESSDVVLFNKGLHFGPDAQVGANPLHMARVTTARPRETQITLTAQIQDLSLFLFFSFLLHLLKVEDY